MAFYQDKLALER